LAQLRCSQKYANAGGACCSNKTIRCKFASSMKSILLKGGAQSTREIERRDEKVSLLLSLHNLHFHPEKISQIIFITTCYRSLITFCRRKTINVNEQTPSCCSCLDAKLCIFSQLITDYWGLIIRGELSLGRVVSHSYLL